MADKTPESETAATAAVTSVGRINTVPTVLRAVADMTKMRFVVVARVTESQWTACAVLDEMDFGLAPGDELEIATTLCSDVRDRREPIVIEHASTSTEYCEHPTPKKYGIESYIAVPIILKNGDFFGTLCAIDSRPAELSSGAILESMRLFSELIAIELGNQASYDALLESESKRRESENRVRSVTDAVPGLISYIDREYRYQFVNQAYTDWFGRKPEDIVRKTVPEVLGAEVFESLSPHIDSALSGKKEIFESEIAYQLGGTRSIRASYTPDIFDGEVRGVFELVVDISEQKLAADALTRSDDRYRAFIRHSTEGIWRFELEEPIPIDLSTEEQVLRAYQYGYLAECNDAMAKLYGFSSAADIEGARLSDLLVADDPANVEFLSAFIHSNYQLSEAESHEKDAAGNDRYFLNNFVGIVENGFLLRAWGTQRDITTSKVAGDATARLAAIVVSSEDAIISEDLMGKITSWNVGATKMFGYKADEVIGKPITVLTPPDRVDESAEIVRKIRREENVEHFETVRRRRDGTDIVVSLTVSPIRNPNGNVIGASKIVRDITERKRIEETIHHNQAVLTLAMQSSRMGVWELDLATKTVSWSEELEDIFGLERGAFDGTEEHFFALMHEDDRDAAWDEVRAAIAENRDYTIEFRFHHTDGGIRWMEGRGEAVYSQKGEPVRLYGVGIDITDRKIAEKALLDSEQRFSRFMQHLPGLAWIKDTDGRYVYANESAESSFGLSGLELYGKTDEDVFPPETAAQFRMHDERAVESGSGIQILESMVGSDGILHHSIVSKFPILGADGKAALIGGMAIDVTDQKQAEEKIRESEERFRNMADHAPVMIWVTESDGTCTYLSESWYEFTGQTPEAGLGFGWLDAVHPDDAPESGRAFLAATETQTPFNVEYRLRRVDGNYRWAIDSAQPRLSESGEFLGFIGSVIDIDERKAAEVALRRYQERFDIVKDAAQVGFWFCDLPFDKLIWDSKVKEHFWLPPDAEVTIGLFYERLHPEDRERTRLAIEKSIASRTPYVIEYRTVGPNGDVNWLRAIGRTFYDDQGKPIRFDGVTLDITQLKKDQEALIRAERMAADEYQALLGRIVPLAATLGRARDLVSIYRSVREFICASMTCTGFFVSFFEPESSMRLAGYVWGEGEEVDISELPPMPLLAEGGGANSRAVYEKRTIITSDYWSEMKDRPHVVLRPNGRDPLSSLIVPMMIKDNVLGTLEVQAHDNEAFGQEDAIALEMAANLAAVAIENVRLIETEAAMREAAEAANRAKDEFLSVLSHELRTPLNAMLGWVRMLKAGVLDADNSERALEVIERNTRLQSSLIEDLLDVSRIISGKMRIETELVDLISVVKTVSETIEPLAEAKGLSYSFSCDDDTVFLTADPVRLQQVVSNLLQNSIKFTPSGGSIEISLARTETESILTVRDSGVGIEEELVPHIFDRFRQADASARRNFTGLGLGLTIVRNIVELHGGSIEVASDGKDRGSVFTVRIPLAADFYDSLDPASTNGGRSSVKLAGK